MESKALSSYEFTVKIGKTNINVKPHVNNDLVFLNLDLQTPFGQINSIFSMKIETFNSITELCNKKGIIPRLADLIEGTFGSRPVVKR